MAMPALARPWQPPPHVRDAVASYAELAYRAYQEAYDDAVRLKQAIDLFVRDPDHEGALQNARQAWLDSRPSYGRTETFRFYDGPIDFVEPLLNSWPVNEAYIDSVRGDPSAGLVNDAKVPITRAMLVERNGRDDEFDVTTGFHAVEFLLWGQDLNVAGPGNRPASDFVGDGAAARRREYLQASTNLLVENLETVVGQWAPGRDNYRARFLAMNPRMSVANMLRGMVSLAGFELAAERLATALDSGSQEDEQSCFSDSTHVDILANVTGIADAYFGRSTHYQGVGIGAAVSAGDADIHARIVRELATSMELARTLDLPFDQTLASPPGSPPRMKVEALITSLQSLSRLFKVAGRTLGVSVFEAVDDD